MTYLFLFYKQSYDNCTSRKLVEIFLVAWHIKIKSSSCSDKYVSQYSSAEKQTSTLYR